MTWKDPSVDVTIGVQNVARELAVETDMSPEDVAAAVDSALSGGVLRLTDAKGREVIVPGAAIGWVQIGSSDKGRVGFGLS